MIFLLTTIYGYGILTVVVQIVQLKGARIVIALDYKSGKSIHKQIHSGIKDLIVTGILKKDDKIPSVRELSIMLTVNPNTVQKAYKEMENDGLIYSVKGKGNFVSGETGADEEKINKLLEDLEKIAKELKFSGVMREKIDKRLASIYKEGE